MHTFKDDFANDHAARDEWLRRAGHCASLTIPPLLPSQAIESGNNYQPLPEAYQSVGARAIHNLTGKLGSAMWPVGRPWFRFEVDPTIRAQFDAETLIQIEDQLYLRELMVRARLEGPVGGSRRRGFGGFRATKRSVIQRLLVCGDSLEHVNDDFRCREFRNDAYVTKRDGSGDVLYHVIRESVDPLEHLTREQIEKAGLDFAELEATPVGERMQELYTRVEWQPLTKVWQIRQQVNGVDIATSQEKYTPFISTAYDLITPEDYGRSFTELQIFADLRSTDALTERVLEFAALACKHHPCIDASSNVMPEDLEVPSGTPIAGCRVTGGVVQDIGWLRAERLAEFSIAAQVLERVEGRVGTASLLDSGAVRDSERTTAFEVQNVTLRELEGALGSVYMSVADEQQIPLVERAIALCERKSFWTKLPEEGVKLQTVTGLAALNREADAQRTLRLIELLGTLPEDAWENVDRRQLLIQAAHDLQLNQPGLIYTDEQLAANAQAKMQQQMELAAAGKMIDTAGNIVEAKASQPPQGA